MLLKLNLTLEEKKTKYDFTFLDELKSNFQWASDAKDAHQMPTVDSSTTVHKTCGQLTGDYQVI